MLNFIIYNYLKCFNSYNDAEFIENTKNNSSTPLDFAIKATNDKIDSNNKLSPYQKESSKALVSLAKYV